MSNEPHPAGLVPPPLPAQQTLVVRPGGHQQSRPPGRAGVEVLLDAVRAEHSGGVVVFYGAGGQEILRVADELVLSCRVVAAP